jgi:hypothetical protein
MEKHIQQILNDIYQFEPSLKSREQELVGIIQEILMLKPETKFDESFRQQLRARLMNRIAHTEPKRSWFDAIINATNMKRLNYGLGVIAVLAILVASTVYINDQNGNNISFFSPGVKITKAGEHAFGELNNVSTAAGRGGQGGGGNTALSSDAGTQAPAAGSAESRIAPGFGGGSADIYVPTNYKYIYKGEPVNLTQTKFEVLKKQKGDNFSMQGLINSLNLGLINLNSFGNAKLQNATFMQDGPDGYYITVDTLNGSISLSGAWPQPLAVDSSHACAKDSDALRAECSVPYNPIKITDIPADEELISIANQFVSQHNISLAAYGAPEVMDDFRQQYELAKDKSLVYLPDMVNVVYPLMLDGQAVYDESGNKSGLMIGVNIRNKKVVSVWDLSIHNYQSSEYDAETNSDRIMRLVSQGGLYGYVDPNAQKTVEIELGEPRIEFVKMWNYSNNMSEELLVPSLIFPVLEQPQGEPYFYRKAVVIPLIKQILDRYPDAGGPIRILPLEDTKAQ